MSIAESMDLTLSAPPNAAAQSSDQPHTVEGIYRRYFGSVWRVLRRLGVLDSQLEDATQDVFLVVHRKLGRFEPRVPVRAWVFAIAVRVASDYRRRARRRPAEPLPETMADGAPDPHERTVLRASVRLLHQLLGELDAKQRAVFVLAELEQLSVPEIAQVLRVNVNTAYSRLRAARKRFEQALERFRARQQRGHAR